jgi:hypothetical protein
MLTTKQELISFAEGVWIAKDPIRILGMSLTATMTILRLNDGGLLLHSPLAMTEQRREAVEALGSVKHLYAPNTFHHLHIGEWATAFPSAQLHASPSLSKKRPDLRIDRVHKASSEPDFAGLLDEIPIQGFHLEECVLFYLPTQTLIVADLVHNVGRPHGLWSAFYTRMMGFYDRVALSRIIRWTAFSDRKAARRSLDDILILPFEAVIVGHGESITSNAKEAVREAYAWL